MGFGLGQLLGDHLVDLLVDLVDRLEARDLNGNNTRVSQPLVLGGGYRANFALAAIVVDHGHARLDKGLEAIIIIII